MQQNVLDAAKVRFEDARKLLERGLDTLRIIGKRSLMSQKGASCLARFLLILDAMSKSSLMSFHPVFVVDILGLVEADQTTTQLEAQASSTPLVNETVDPLSTLTMTSLTDYIFQATEDFFFYNDPNHGNVGIHDPF